MTDSSFMVRFEFNSPKAPLVTPCAIVIYSVPDIVHSAISLKYLT